ncbi:hypothetical protein [uncultured Bdellovibrio sp.]|uniref:hypothetical protein n=1 Tax=Bdellovibrio sp. HCB-162 TaxID=3394234 RepID=UPI0025FF2856|nr:hypothetical protein [uncultured Bdellovibrio sp.]
MATIWKFTKFVLVLLVIVGLSWVVLANYSVIFSKTVVGEITGVERVEIPVALMARSDGDITSKVFSFAIGIKDQKTGEIYTASSEDRQWAVAQKGQCAEAVFLPYPPWQFTKKDTYFGARLVRLFECAK